MLQKEEHLQQILYQGGLAVNSEFFKDIDEDILGSRKSHGNHVGKSHADFIINGRVRPWRYHPRTQNNPKMAAFLLSVFVGECETGGQMM